VNAATTLSKFGKQIKDTGKITPKEKKTLKAIASIPTIIPKLFIEDAILATGVNYITKEPVVLSSLTGNHINPCTQTVKENYSSKNSSACRTKAIPPSSIVESVLSSTQPIEGKIIKDGIEILATYIPTMIVLYKGSHCMTYYISGFKYEFCLDIPHTE
jgi:hypothetical protein